MAQGRRQKKCPRSKDRRPYITDRSIASSRTSFLIFSFTCMRPAWKTHHKKRKKKQSCQLQKANFHVTASCLSVWVYQGPMLPIDHFWTGHSMPVIQRKKGCSGKNIVVFLDSVKSVKFYKPNTRSYIIHQPWAIKISYPILYAKVVVTF